ncbi:MAG: MoaD/ThiS family protein [Dehalococcoidia bacterium]|jgi:molybdopterin converting factor small subunit|nr:MoaD/ThiS family protein [Dehalococcoidia bacterium]MDP6510112.1 MoaD/ThiS family protein [Dehalococcoidia bacterium]MDP6782019.1 MoaD/ThiS family protein [Dehalococcoidia bacterium]|tara:strand:- start:287 stop:562 length:276 start_codon:yes stop_codon:yes gene_type:complete
MTRLHLRFQGVFEELTQRKDQALELTNPTLHTTVATMEGQYGPRFTKLVSGTPHKIGAGMSVLVNGQPRNWDAPLLEGDEVLFLTAFGGIL